MISQLKNIAARFLIAPRASQLMARFPLALLLLLSVQLANAQTLVRVSTPLGDFDIELYDAVTPVTVENFLNYVNSGRYNGTFIHRSVPGFIIQGGWLSYQPQTNTATSIDTDPDIVNEPGISNLRGTIAMAKIADDPDSATSQWFINVDDNSDNLDTQNGGFTVFGRIAGDGMTVVDAIANLPTEQISFGGGAEFPVPLIDYDGGSFQASNFVTVQMSVEATVSPNVYDPVSGLLNLSIDAGSLGIAAVSFSIESQDPQVIIRALANTLVMLPEVRSGFATFDTSTGQLVIPELVVDGSVAYQNVVFVLTDAGQLLFSLLSVE